MVTPARAPLHSDYYKPSKVRSSAGDRKLRALPPEILIQVFEMLFDDHNSALLSKEQALRALNRSIQMLSRCCLVSRLWYSAARGVLYTRRLVLCNIKTARLLLRTLQGNTGSPYPTFAQIVTRIVSLCPELWCLEAEWGPLEFPFLASLPVFQSLQWLRVTSQYLDLLAPLLPHLPNLTRLNIIYLIADSSRPGREMRRIAPPTFRLKTLQLSQAELTLSQYQWLLASSSHSLEYLELQQLSRSADLLGRTIGRAVSSLHVKGPADSPRKGDPDLVDALPHFPKLKSLRVSGYGWQWQKLFYNIAADLRSLAVTYSRDAAEILVVALANPKWQPGLRTVTAFHYAGGGNEVGRSLDAQLEYACSKRAINLFRVPGGTIM
ncbi:hypothetical protein E1B28_007384 [Marasmius oreades]|uniref:F-box domain-containing protein n=1 Tax=Marasmius oreades TaxID=181124 RepID=A0A9P7S396_9AGAR|nr:uncharacterized protein E1B28_007384 [Marasmius oreades]KAG7093733.1 hypothetical protein E1B28_007384 [Marasmius oreades]